jgi:hypothetical protein
MVLTRRNRLAYERALRAAITVEVAARSLARVSPPTTYYAEFEESQPCIESMHGWVKSQEKRTAVPTMSLETDRLPVR